MVKLAQHLALLAFVGQLAIDSAALAAPASVVRGEVRLLDCINMPAADDGSCAETPMPHWTLALVKIADGRGREAEFVEYVTSDTLGRFSITVSPGTYRFVSKFEVTHDPDDATPRGFSLLTADEFVVRNGGPTELTVLYNSVVVNTIGVGN